MTTKAKGFSKEEQTAMKQRALELMANKGNGEEAVLAKIATMKGSDKVLATKIHELVRKNAPELGVRTWYGMPAYTNSQGKVVCFFQDAVKFKVRYATLGFQHDANLDDGNMWPTGFALLKITAKEEAEIVRLIKKAVS